MQNPRKDRLIAECLSLLSPKAGIENDLRVLGAVKGEAVRRLLGKLRGLVPHASQPVESDCNRASLSCPLPSSVNHPRASEEASRCFAK
jgi:hypothetical protein